MSSSSFLNVVGGKLHSRRLSNLLLIFLPDVLAISMSAITSYSFRFPSKANEGKNLPAIAQFDYRGILLVVVIAWVLMLIFTGTYRPIHANLVVFNLRLLIRRSLIFFLLLGFLSFILRASFSRTVFLVMLGSGLVYLFIFRDRKSTRLNSSHRT